MKKIQEARKRSDRVREMLQVLFFKYSFEFFVHCLSGEKFCVSDSDQ